MKSNRQAKREAKELFRLCLVDGLMDEARARDVVRTAAGSGRRDARGILAHFLRLVKLDQARHTAKIESATPLQPELQAAIESSLEGRYGAGLFTTFSLRPELIGGVRIQAASDVYDGSVLAGLKRMERSF